MNRKKAIQAVDAGTAVFGEWFAAQFGACPEPNVSDNERSLLDAIDMTEYELAKLQQRLAVLRIWKNNYESALLAWNAAGGKLFKPRSRR